MNKKIILATASKYRIKAFQEAGFEFETESSDINEKFETRPENPLELVKLLSRLKAEKVYEKRKEDIVIGFDSIGYFKDKILEKPESEEEAHKRIQELSENEYSFFTGIYIIYNGKTLPDLSETKVTMRKIYDKEIEEYLKSDKEKRYKTFALGFDPLSGISSTFIKKINGSYNNLLYGIPLELIKEKLIENELD